MCGSSKIKILTRCQEKSCLNSGHVIITSSETWFFLMQTLANIFQKWNLLNSRPTFLLSMHVGFQLVALGILRMCICATCERSFRKKICVSTQFASKFKFTSLRERARDRNFMIIIFTKKCLSRDIIVQILIFNISGPSKSNWKILSILIFPIQT